jgi:DNA-binding IclR family transcriptional regulator
MFMLIATMAHAMADEVNRPIKSLVTMDQLVSTLEAAGSMRVTDLATEIDRPQSVVHDYLSTLSALGYVIQTDTGAYQLSFRYLEIGGTIRSQTALYDVAKPEITRLAQKSATALVTLSTEQRGQCVALAVIQGEQNISYDFTAGTRFDMHSSGVGKAMLAEYSSQRVEEIIDRHGLKARTEHTITDRDALFSELDHIAQRDVAYDREEYRLGMATISSALTTATGTVLGGVSVTIPAHVLRDESVIESLKTKLLATTNVIELNIASE